MAFSWQLCVLFVIVGIVSGTPVERKRDLHGKRVYLRHLTVAQAKSLMQVNATAMPDGVDPPMNDGVDPDHPEIMPVTMHTDEEGHIHGLLLQRNFRIEHPVTISYNDGVTETENTLLNAEGHAQYQDTMTRSVFGVRHVDGKKHFDGHFYLDGAHYEVHPQADDDGVRARGFEEHHPHIISRTEPLNYSDPVDLKDEHVRVTKTSKQKRGGHLDVEMAIVIDYGYYLRWLDEKGSQSAAISEIKYMFSYNYNGLDFIYNTVDYQGMTVTPWLKTLHIQTSSSGNLAIQLNPGINPSGGRENVVDGMEILDQMALSWGPANGFGVPNNYDTVLTYVGYRISRDGSPNVIGIAFTGHVCTPYGYSIVEDQGFNTFKVAAHELGHTLGAKHDLDASGDCSPGKHHIMEAQDAMPNEANNMDGYTFSTCSLARMLEYTSRDTANCLGNGGSNSFGPVSTSTLPGEKFDPTEQCLWYHSWQNPSSYHCRGSRTTVAGEECWRGLWCSNNPTNCQRTSNLRAAEGTSCGSGKKCIHSKCQ